MGNKNGYFQVKTNTGGVFLKILPAQGAGENVTVGEVTDYLSLKGLSFNLLKVDELTKEASGEYERISDEKAVVERENMDLTISSDGVRVVARFYAPFEGGELMTKEEILSDLKYNQIIYGIKEENIDEFLRTREYCKDFVVAEGNAMQEGKDAYIEYLFRTDLLAKPAQNEDGSVDYHNLDNICHISEGDVLARIIPAVPGIDGRTVDGRFIVAPIPRNVKIQYGQNARLSDDKLELISTVNGHVTLVDGRVFVSSVLQLPNVDTSTGDINYDGSVEVQGNVKSGFSITAAGDVEVHGVVEGAAIKAGGQIIIHRGINGMSRGVLESGSNIVAKFIENATVSAEGYIETDCIIHSTVTAGDHITVQGKKGFITGGIVRAGNVVEAKTLGSDIGAATQIEVGIDPKLKKQHADLLKENDVLQKDILRLDPVVKAVGERLGKGEKIPIEQLKQIKELSKTLAACKEKLKGNLILITKLENKFDVDTAAVVKVTGEAFPGTSIIISDCRMVLKTSYHYCRFMKEGADVVMRPF